MNRPGSKSGSRNAGSRREQPGAGVGAWGSDGGRSPSPLLLPLQDASDGGDGGGGGGSAMTPDAAHKRPLSPNELDGMTVRPPTASGEDERAAMNRASYWRKSLEFNPRVRTLLLKLWKSAEVPGKRLIEREEYSALRVRSAKAVLAGGGGGGGAAGGARPSPELPSSEAEVRRAAAKDWPVDSLGYDFLDYERFTLLMFKLAERARRTSTADEYARYLERVCAARASSTAAARSHPGTGLEAGASVVVDGRHGGGHGPLDGGGSTDSAPGRLGDAALSGLGGGGGGGNVNVWTRSPSPPNAHGGMDAGLPPMAGQQILFADTGGGGGVGALDQQQQQQQQQQQHLPADGRALSPGGTSYLLRSPPSANVAFQPIHTVQSRLDLPVPRVARASYIGLRPPPSPPGARAARQAAQQTWDDAEAEQAARARLQAERAREEAVLQAELQQAALQRAVGAEGALDGWRFGAVGSLDAAPKRAPTNKGALGGRAVDNRVGEAREAQQRALLTKLDFMASHAKP